MNQEHPMTTTIRVVVADDHPIVIEGLKNILAAHESIALVGVANSFKQVPSVLHQTNPDILILDLSGMGDAALSLMQRLQREYPTVAVIIFSTYLDCAGELIELGARGYVTKTEMGSDLVCAIIAVARGELCVSPAVARHLEQSHPDATFTPRETLALKLFIQGKETPEIAQEMHIKRHSVQNLFNAMLQKTGCKSRRELTEWYRRMYGSSN
jgi:DNA-binding NarL/FixJ family response regulator